VPRLPVISGRVLVAFMESLGYEVVRQRGSQIRLRLENESGVWPETVPDHREVARGTLRGVLKRISLATNLDIEQLIHLLSKF
jgi:predicted RNA binding protein YcfA (HicA-like mRNA interferase family)